MIYFPSGSLGQDPALALIRQRCGECHGLALAGRCLAGRCADHRVHQITPRPWDLVLPWMRAMGCTMTDREEEVIRSYLMKGYGTSHPITWERAGQIPGGWNVVALADFKGRLYSGIEGNGGVFRLDGETDWVQVLSTPNYTVYGLVPFQGRLFAGTNDPAAEIWAMDALGSWHRTSVLEGEKGVISLGVFSGRLYAGTTRGAVYRSTDGTHWTLAADLLDGATAGFSNWVRFLTPLNGRLYAGIERGGIFRSADGTRWEAIWPAGERGGVRGVAVFRGDLYVGTTTGGEIWRHSPGEGTEWMSVFPKGNKDRAGYVASMSVFNDHLFAGIGGKVFRSKDGDDWEEVGHLTPFTIEAMAVFDGGLYAGTTLPPNAWVYRMAVKESVVRVSNPATVGIGKEIAIAVRAKDEEEDPVAAWDGHRYLVVWQSTREGPTRIHATQVSPTGDVRQPDGFSLSKAKGDQLFPMLAWGKDRFLVVWQDLRSRKQWEIFGAMVDGDGRVLAENDIPVSTGKGSRKYPAIAWNGSSFLVVWMEENPKTGWDIFGARVTPEGEVLDPGGIVIGQARGDQAHPMVAWTGNNYLVVWMDGRTDPAQDIFGARVDGGGRLLDPKGIAIATTPEGQMRPAVAWSGKVGVVVWADGRKGATMALYGTRIDADGKVLDPEGIPLSTAPHLHMFPDIACRERECMVIWEQEAPGKRDMRGIQDIVRDIKGMRLEASESGSLKATRPFDLAPGALGNHFPKVSTDGERFLAVWKDYRSGIAAGFGRMVEFSRTLE